MEKSIKGVVKKFTGLGHKLGYPTANIDISEDAEEGVFAGYTKINFSFPPLEGEGKGGVKLPSVIFIGSPETFNDSNKRLETHILDFSGDLYGQEIKVEIMMKLRDNRKFSSEEALVEQMKLDEKRAREYFKNIL